MKNKPDITPIGSASKYITIRINDTLQPNTTYAFNFGNSITDNNEGNPYPYYRYVFSTGDYIDSLTVKGRIVDALKRKPETFVSVALYEIDSTFNDSVVYNKTPKYITNTLDSVTTFSIENIKAGTYMLYALKDGNSDNKFQQLQAQLSELRTDGLHLTIEEMLLYQSKAGLIDLKASRNQQSRMSGNYLARSKGRGMEFDEVRHYQMGDDIRSIDWRVTARTGITHTKLFKEEVLNTCS